MKNILYTIILSFLFSFSVFGDYQAGVDAYDAGDYETAYKEFRVGVEQGDPAAQFHLGVMYYQGNGVLRDYKEAVKWFRLSSEQGYAYAQLVLAVSYVQGKGVIQDNVIAHMWFNISGRDGSEDAKKSMDILESEMTSEQLAKAQKLARECIKKNYKDCGY